MPGNFFGIMVTIGTFDDPIEGLDMCSMPSRFVKGGVSRS